jgi:DNA end-binding protein Ku
MWKGAITFGLVTVPVNLYSATRRQAEIPFHLLHRKDLAPIDYRRYCTAEDVPVEWSDIVRGYEYAKGQFVVMTEEDLEKARVAATQTFEIRDFVPGEQIDFAYFQAPYWLEPARQGRKAYSLLCEALTRSRRVGIGTIVMRQREYLAALRPSGKALMLTTMRFADEIRPAEELDLPTESADKRELDLALQLVDTLASDWKPEKYHDTYREVLRKVIEQKVEGKEVAVPPPSKPPKVIDLMEALRASLKAPRDDTRKGPSRAPAREHAQRERKGAARKAAGRRRAA